MKRFIKRLFYGAGIILLLLLLIGLNDDLIIDTLNNTTAKIEQYDSAAAGRKAGESVDTFMRDLTRALRSPEQAFNQWGLALHENALTLFGLGEPER